MRRDGTHVERRYIVPRMPSKIALLVIASAAAVILASAPSSRAAPSSEIVGITSLASGAGEA